MLRRAVVMAFTSALLVVIAPVSASAKAAKCQRAPSKIVKLIGSDLADGATLTNGRQVPAPPGDRKAAGGAWFIAAKVVGGPLDGNVATWARVVIRSGSNGIFIAIDDNARAISDLGADIIPATFVNVSTSAYDRVVACAAK